jgi:hypothetical protein
MNTSSIPVATVVWLSVRIPVQSGTVMLCFECGGSDGPKVSRDAVQISRCGRFRATRRHHP